MPAKKAVGKKAKKSVEGGKSKRKGGKRSDLALAGVARLVKAGAAGPISRGVKGKVARVSKKAAQHAQDMLQDMLGNLAETLKLHLGKAKTAKPSHIKSACNALRLSQHVCEAIGDEGRKALSVAGVMRYTKAQGVERFTKDGKLKLRAVAMAYLSDIGSRAGCVAAASKRNTIKFRDFEAVKCN